jgi:hypothetical protein
VTATAARRVCSPGATGTAAARMAAIGRGGSGAPSSVMVTTLPRLPPAALA